MAKTVESGAVKGSHPYLPRSLSVTSIDLTYIYPSCVQR